MIGKELELEHGTVGLLHYSAITQTVTAVTLYMP
jgi:hypothetical protein